MTRKDNSKILDQLIEFITTKEKTVKNIESDKTNYKEIIWFSELPATILKNNFPHKEGFHDPGIWIKINMTKELKEPSFPSMSDVLELWADKESLKDEYGTPRLKQSIFVNGKTLLSTNYPQIETEFKEYVRDKWLDDLIVYKENYKTHELKKAENRLCIDTYEKLEKLYHETESMEEDMELVACSGLIYSKSEDSKQNICRHLLIHKAEITFDALQKEALIEIKPDIENSIQIETDVLMEMDDRFDNETIISAERELYDFLK